MVKALSLHAVVRGSNPVLTSGQDLFRWNQILDEYNSSTLCKQPTGCLLPARVLNHVSVKFQLFLSDC